MATKASTRIWVATLGIVKAIPHQQEAVMQKALASDRRNTWERCIIWHVIHIPAGTSAVDLVDFCDPEATDGEVAWLSNTAAYVITRY
jgi:hypothetical protein